MADKDITVDANLTTKTAIVDDDRLLLIDSETNPDTLKDTTKADLRKKLFASPAQGDVLYYSGTDWVRLAAGTNGYYLQTQGTGANPQWAAVSASGGSDKYPMEFRLTLESGVPVSASDQTAKTTMYCTPYKGNQIALYDGVSAWTTYTSAQFSLALGTLTSGKNYDVFCYNNAGTPTLEFTAWTNDTTRATALTTQDGVYVKSGATTRRYLGTFRTTATTTTEDSDTKRFVYNYYNRVARNMNKYVSGTHTYTTASWKQWNSDTSTKIEFVIGVVEDAEYLYIGGDAYGGSGYVAFGLNTTSSGSSPSIRNANASQVEMGQTRAYAPSLGYQYIAAVEYGGSGFTMNAITVGGFIFA